MTGKRAARHTYWALVACIRTGRGSRQRIVACLGEWKKRERSGWVQWERRLDKRERPSPTLFDPPEYAEPDADVELVRINGVRPERMRDGGDVRPAPGLRRLLGLAELLTNRVEAGREEVPFPMVAGPGAPADPTAPAGRSR